MATPFQPAGTPVSWRLAIAGGVISLTALAYLLIDQTPPQVRAALGVVAFLGVAFACSSDLRRINWRVVGSGMLLQIALALLILKVEPVREAFAAIGGLVKQFLGFTSEVTGTLFGRGWDPVPLALIILPTVVFVACVFTVLFYVRVLPAIVWVLAKGMVLVLGKRGVSGAETLSAVANVFMGQTEAPLIVAPYVARMTRSELLALMVGGMATVAGGVMAVYIEMNADAVAILATSVMAAPCGLYISKILIPETEEPLTRGEVRVSTERPYANVIDAAAGGASEGMKLAINIIAMLIAFTALIALVNYLLGLFQPGLTLQWVFGQVFAPVAVLMGVDPADVPKVGGLLGVKLVGNEFLAFDFMTKNYQPEMAEGMSGRSYSLASFALTGFANLSSIGIQLGGIGALPRVPGEQTSLRARLARLGPRALLGGFLATLINAAVAGVILD
jgi:CNT family concentrative nucleoside transporter